MTLIEAVDIVRELQPFQIKRLRHDTRDPMLQSVCDWCRTDGWDALLEAVGRPPSDTEQSGRMRITVGEKLRTLLVERGPLSRDVLCHELKLTRSYLGALVSRLREKGHAIETVKGLDGIPRYQLSETP